MTPRTLSGSRHALESCVLQLHAWRPFDCPGAHCQLRAKKPCLSDRSTVPPAFELSRLSLLDDPAPPYKDPHGHGQRGFPWIARKRRRRGGSRSVSGRSSDRSGTRCAACATCSDFPLAAGGTDSSGELFVNGDASWGSDASEAMRASNKRGEGRDIGGGEKGASLEREGSGSGTNREGGAVGALELQGNESGYGSETGYRGDGELGYDGEIDEEEDDGRLMIWGRALHDHMEIVGENNFSEQKTHHRCRRRKHDWRIVAPLRW